MVFITSLKAGFEIQSVGCPLLSDSSSSLILTCPDTSIMMPQSGDVLVTVISKSRCTSHNFHAIFPSTFQDNLSNSLSHFLQRPN